MSVPHACKGSRLLRIQAPDSSREFGLGLTTFPAASAEHIIMHCDRHSCFFLPVVPGLFLFFLFLLPNTVLSLYPMPTNALFVSYNEF